MRDARSASRITYSMGGVSMTWGRLVTVIITLGFAVVLAWLWLG